MSVRGKGSRRRQTRRGRRSRPAGRHGWEETAGSPYSMLTLPASLSSRRRTERTAFAVSLSSASKQLTNIFFAILVDCGCCYMFRPRNTIMGSENFEIPWPMLVFRGPCLGNLNRIMSPWTICHTTVLVSVMLSVICMSLSHCILRRLSHTRNNKLRR